MMIKSPHEIAILMSCYNGEKYLRKQIDSILSQSYKDWDLYIRDDGSKDSTLQIIKEYSDNYENIHLYIDKCGNVGPKQSFFLMLESIDANYYAYSDQDDVWLDNKLKIGYDAISKHSLSKPIMFQSNVKLVDSELNIISDDFWKLAKLNPYFSFSFMNQAVNPSIIGMTMMFNKGCKPFIFPYDKEHFMHDSWTALQVLKNGDVISCKEPLVLYRQHANNYIGARAPKGLSGIMWSVKENFAKAKVCRNVLGIPVVKFLYYKSCLLIKKALL